MTSSPVDFAWIVHDAAASGDVEALVSAAGQHPHLIDACDSDGRTPMHVAAVNGHASVVAALHRLGSTALDRPEDQTPNRTPMHLAAFYGRASVVETLHRLGSAALSELDSLRWTPMRIAVERGQTSVVETLHRIGCPTLDDSGWYYLEIALRSSHIDVAELLIAIGVEERGYQRPLREDLRTTDERLARLRYRLHFLPTLLDRLLDWLR